MTARDILAEQIAASEFLEVVAGLPRGSMRRAVALSNREPIDVAWWRADSGRAMAKLLRALEPPDADDWPYTVSNAYGFDDNLRVTVTVEGVDVDLMGSNWRVADMLRRVIPSIPWHEMTREKGADW